MTKYESQSRAIAKYQKEKCRTVTVRFFPADADLFEHLDAHANKAGYIKELIRRDMGQGGE